MVITVLDTILVSFAYPNDLIEYWYISSLYEFDNKYNGKYSHLNNISIKKNLWKYLHFLS